MFVDTKSLNGILFTSKQEMLGLSEVDVNAGKNSVRNLLSINSKLYSPTSTIAQAALTPEGIHIGKQGIVPVDIAQSLFGLILGKDKGRLVNLYDRHIKNTSIGNILYSYSGGPGSIGGIGTTNIKLASDKTVRKSSIILASSDIPNISVPILGSMGVSIPSILKVLNISVTDYRKLHISETNRDSETFIFRQNDKKYRIGASGLFNDITKTQFASNLDTSFVDVTGKAKSSADVKPGDILKISEPSSLPYDEIIDLPSSLQIGRHKIRPDFRDKIDKKGPLYSKGLDYEKGNIESRTNFETTKYSIKDYSITSSIIYDSINAKEIYKSNKFESVNDLVKFRISVIDNDNPNLATYMHFRAYIDSFSDSYDSKWNAVNYVGRGEDFYRYGGFTRGILLSWTVVAQSKAELAPMYRKLNYLASSLAPNYSRNGYMRGNIVKLTIGGYLFEQPGIITSLKYDVPTEATWEIGIGTEIGKNDPSVKELPHMIRVTNVNFIPIHQFVPQLFNGDFEKQGEKFIALSNGISTGNTNENDLYYDKISESNIVYNGYK